MSSFKPGTPVFSFQVTVWPWINVHGEWMGSYNTVELGQLREKYGLDDTAEVSLDPFMPESSADASEAALRVLGHGDSGTDTWTLKEETDAPQVRVSAELVQRLEAAKAELEKVQATYDGKQSLVEIAREALAEVLETPLKRALRHKRSETEPPSNPVAVETPPPKRPRGRPRQPKPAYEAPKMPKFTIFDIWAAKAGFDQAPAAGVAPAEHEALEEPALEAEATQEESEAVNAAEEQQERSSDEVGEESSSGTAPLVDPDTPEAPAQAIQPPKADYEDELVVGLAGVLLVDEVIDLTCDSD